MNDPEFPLQNPSAEDLMAAEQVMPGVEQELIAPPPKYQLDLGIEPTWNEKFRWWVGDLRARAKKREVELEHIPFWQNFAPPFAVTTAIFVVILTATFGIIKFNSLPSIPFYYNAVEARWEKENSIALLIIPLALAAVEFLAIRAIRNIFSFDRRLSYMLSWCQAVINILILIASIQIYTLIS